MPLGAAKAALLGAAGSGGDDSAIKWIAGMNGTGSSYSLLFDSIPQTYRHLRIVLGSVMQSTNGVYTEWKINGNSTGLKMADYYQDDSTVYNFWRQQLQTGRWPQEYTPYSSGGPSNVGALIADFQAYTAAGTGVGYAQSTMQAMYGPNNSATDNHVGGVVWAPDNGSGSYIGDPVAITSIEIITDHSSYHWQTNMRADLYGIGSA